jgi:hypothetical protein
MDRMSEVLRGGTTVLFVSHNLHAVSELCQRSVLLEKGKMVANGPTDEVIRQYIGSAQQNRADEGAQLTIESVTVHNVFGPTAKFESGEKAYLTVNLNARQAADDVSVVVQIVDDNFYPIFDTCNARLNDGISAALKAGDALEVTFELDLHLAAGTYHVNVYAHEYVRDRPFSTWRSAVSFFVAETRLIKGRANLYPKLAVCRVSPGSPKPRLVSADPAPEHTDGVALREPSAETVPGL